MIGLIKKDLFIIKQNIKVFIIIFFIYLVMAINGATDITFILPFIITMSFISTFSYDDFNHWHSYATTLPCGRKMIVKSKYIVALLLTVISSIIGFCISLLIAKINNTLVLDELIPSLIGCILGLILLISVMFPLLFKFGAEKGRIWIFIGVFGVVIIVDLLAKIIDLSYVVRLLEYIENLWYIIIPLISIIFLVISYYISKRIYLNKEF